MSKMKAAFITAPKTIQMGEKEVPTIADNEVLVQIKHVGICGADLEFFKEGRIGGWVLEFPHVLGHEPAGVVAEVGKNVKGLQKSDKVSIEPGKPCWECEFCRSGHYNLCPEVQFMSVPGVTGAFQEYVAWPAKLVYKLPENVDTMAGALVEPLAVGINAVQQSGAKFGHTAAVLGCGCIGLTTALALKAVGINTIYMTDHNKARMDKAKALGITAVYNENDTDVVKSVLEATGGRGVDMVYECTGSERAVNQGIGMLAKGGCVTLVGLFGQPTQAVDLNGLIFKEGFFASCFRYRNAYPMAIAAIASGNIKINDIVSHKYKLEELGQALEFNTTNKREVTKVVIEF